MRNSEIRYATPIRKRWDGITVYASVPSITVSAPSASAWALQGYLAYKKHPPPRTLQWDYA